jgi:hypothetical protein
MGRFVTVRTEDNRFISFPSHGDGRALPSRGQELGHLLVRRRSEVFIVPTHGVDTA